MSTSSSRPRPSAKVRIRSAISHRSTPTAVPGGVAPSRSCSMSWRIRSSEFSTVSNMSRWNSGFWLWRWAFFIISASCVTMFFRSCTTNADMRLKASNLRTSSKASVACICARKLAACRPAVFRRSLTSQFTSTRVRARAKITKPINSSEAVRGTINHACSMSCSQPGKVRLPYRREKERNSSRLMTQPLVMRNWHSGDSVSSRTSDSGWFQRATWLKDFSPRFFIHKPPPGLSSKSARPRTTCWPICWGEFCPESVWVKRSHSSR